MLKIFSKSRPIRTEQDKLIYYVDRIVNITIVKTERGDNESVKSTLKDLEEIFKDFLKLRKNNPDKFNSLLWSSDFYDRYVKPTDNKKPLDTEATEATKSDEDLQKEASFRLFLDSQRELKGLTRFLNSFQKIWRAAVSTGNEEISRYTIYHLIYILSELTQEPSNQLLIKQFLELLNSITREVIKRSEATLDPSAYSAATHWYTNIVFRTLTGRDQSFQIEYLQTFNGHLFTSAQIIVAQNQKILFESLVSALLTIHIPIYRKGRIYDLGTLLRQADRYDELQAKYGLSKKLRKLARDGDNIDSTERLNDWIKEFDRLSEIIEKNIPEKALQEATRLKDEIYEYASSMYKYSELLDLVFAIGSYCLFKKKYKFIKQLWEYKQPSDADGSWVGHDIVPNNLDDVMKLYFRNRLSHDKYEFHEGHHGSAIYRKQYLILLFLRALRRMAADEQGRKAQIEGYNLQDAPSHVLSDLSHSADELKETAKDLRTNEDLLEALGFVNMNDLLDKSLPHFFDTVKIKARKKLSDLEKVTKISQERVEEFKNNVLDEFNKRVILRKILKQHNLYEDKTEEEVQESERFGINMVADKAQFFHEWYVSYLDAGRHYGRNLAEGEDRRLIETIRNLCLKSPTSDFEGFLKAQTGQGNLIIFAATDAVYDYFYDHPNFTPKWKTKHTFAELYSFEGFYNTKKFKIALFAETYLNPLKQIMVIDTSRLGKLVQYSPLNEEDNKQLKKEIFYMDVLAFGEDEKLTEELIQKPPEWLREIGDPEKQKDHLLNKALVQVLERFDFKKHAEFRGYLLDASEVIAGKKQ